MAKIGYATGGGPGLSFIQGRRSDFLTSNAPATIQPEANGVHDPC